MPLKNLFIKRINLQKDFAVNSLNTRATAKKLVNKIESSWINTIVLDFSDIEFASRSFLDELNSHLPHIDKEVKKKNMNASVKEMDELVQQPREEVKYSNTKSKSGVLTF